MRANMQILILAVALSLLAPSNTEAQDTPLKADYNKNLKPNELNKALRDLKETVDEETRDLPTDHYIKLTEWVLKEFGKWKKLPPPEDDQIKVSSTPPEPTQPDSFGGPDFRKRAYKLSEFDFVFTLNSIFEKLFFSKPDTALQEFISLAKKHPILRSETQFAPLLNNYLIAANIQKLIGTKALSQSLPDAKGKLPDFLIKADPQLQSAWRKAKFIENTLNKLYPDDGLNTIPVLFLADNESFDSIIGECLIDNNWANADAIQNYTWGTWCRFGSGEFLWQKLNFLTIQQAQQGKMDEALALLLYSWLSSRDNLSSVLYDFDNKRRDELISSKLIKSGIKWESPACGILFMPFLRQAPDRLARKGGHDTLDILSHTKGLELPDSKNILEIIVGILKRHSDHDRQYLGDPFAEAEGGKFALNQSSEGRAMQALASLVHKVGYGSVITDSIILLADRSPDTSKNDLLRLALSPIPSVSRSAYYALKKQGHLDELKSHSPSKQEKYNLTFLLGGKPLSNLPIYTDQILIDPDLKVYKPFSWKTGEELDDKGRMQLTRNNDSHTSDTKGLFAAYPESGELPIRWTPKTPIFAFMESFADLKKRKDQIIDIPLNPLTIKLQIPKNRLARPKNEQTTQVIISTRPLLMRDSELSVYFHGANYKLETQQDYIEIDWAGPARYSIHVQAPGCAIYTQAEPINVTREQEILIKLKPGHQLKYSLDSKKTGDFSVSLMREHINKKLPEKWEYISEVEYHWQFINWNHLEPGKYKLSVLNQSKFSLDPTEIEFEIKHGDPEIVDLGKIKVPH